MATQATIPNVSYMKGIEAIIYSTIWIPPRLMWAQMLLKVTACHTLTTKLTASRAQNIITLSPKLLHFKGYVRSKLG